jgi:hypothetical protein
LQPFVDSSIFKSGALSSISTYYNPIKKNTPLSVLTDAGVFFLSSRFQFKFMKGLSLLLVLLFSISNLANAFELTPAAEVSILTCSPGDDFYESYGHSAIRVKDINQNFDMVFNYGTFSFSEDFMKMFVLGKLRYWLEPESYPNFRYQYDSENRSIYEQILDITPTQKQQFFDYVLNNAKEENKYYWYDFLYNNCSSKLRDVIEESTGVEFSEKRTKKSFRELIDSYNRKAEWYDFGIDLALGAKIDQRANFSEQMFLPDYLMNTLDETQIAGQPLVKVKQTVLDNGYEFYSEKKLMGTLKPALFFWVILILFFLFKLYYKGPNNPLFSVFFLTIMGLSGWFLLFLWLGTDHGATKWNLNILWAIPLHFPMALFLLKKNKPKWVAQYFFFARVVLITTLMLWPFIPQQFHIAILPIILISLLSISSNIPISMKDYQKEEKLNGK